MHPAAEARTGGPACATPVRSSGFRSDGPDLDRLRALGAAAGRVLDPLVFLEAAVPVSLDGGVVDEDIGSAVVGGDEAVTLVGVEPLHFALSHYFLLRRSSGPRARDPGCCDRLSPEARLWDPRRRDQNFAGAVTRTRTSTTTRTSKHHRAGWKRREPARRRDHAAGKSTRPAADQALQPGLAYLRWPRKPPDTATAPRPVACV